MADRTDPTARNYAGAPQPDACFCPITREEIVNTLFTNEYLKKKENQMEKPRLAPLPSLSSPRARGPKAPLHCSSPQQKDLAAGSVRRCVSGSWQLLSGLAGSMEVYWAPWTPQGYCPVWARVRHGGQANVLHRMAQSETRWSILSLRRCRAVAGPWARAAKVDLFVAAQLRHHGRKGLPVRIEKVFVASISG